MYVRFTTTTSDKLSTLAVTNGQIIALADVDGYYYDMGGVRHSATGVKMVDMLPAVGQQGLVYIFNNKFYLWDGTRFVGAESPIATVTTPGLVKPDGSTIKMLSDGTIYTSGAGVSSFNGRYGAVTLTSADVTNAIGYTPAPSGSSVTSFNTRTGAITLTKADVTGALGYTPPTTNTTYSASGAGLALTGTAFSNTGVTSFKTRTGAVTPASGDYTATLVTRTESARVPGNTVEKSLVAINQVNTFPVATSSWVSTSDYGYTVKAVINSSIYSNDSVPVWTMIGTGAVTTKAEETEAAKVRQAYFSSSGVTLYAISVPARDLKLYAKGI